jgi:hypothetical protein
MLLNIVVIFSTGLLSFAFADTTYSTTTTSSSTSSSAVATHTIAVGAVSGLPHSGENCFMIPNADHFQLLGRRWI